MVFELLVNVEQNIFSIESIITLLLLFAGILLYAQDFKVGVLTNFIIFSGMFALSFVIGLDWKIFLIISLAHLVLLTLSLYMVSESSNKRFT